jgi:hypothetical protein
MQGYIVEYGFVPDEDYVNTNPTPEYLGYFMGVDDALTRVMWVIEPVVLTPTVTIEDLLPAEYEEVTIDTDINSFGLVRKFLPSMNIEDVIDFIQAQVDSIAE